MNTRRSRRDLELSGASPAVEGPAPSWGEGPEPGSAAERLAYSVSEAARLTGLSRDLLYDEMRRGHLHYIKVGRRRLITRHHLEQFLGIGPQPVLSPPQRVSS
jgi:excisionase family DNA binding protein